MKSVVSLSQLFAVYVGSKWRLPITDLPCTEVYHTANNKLGIETYWISNKCTFFTEDGHNSWKTSRLWNRKLLNWSPDIWCMTRAINFSTAIAKSRIWPTTTNSWVFFGEKAQIGLLLSVSAWSTTLTIKCSTEMIEYIQFYFVHLNLQHTIQL